MIDNKNTTSPGCTVAAGAGGTLRAQPVTPPERLVPRRRQWKLLPYDDGSSRLFLFYQGQTDDNVSLSADISIDEAKLLIADLVHAVVLHEDGVQ